MTVVFLTPGEPEEAQEAVWEPTPLHTQTLLVEVPASGPPDSDGVPARSTTSVVLGGCNVQRVAVKESPDGSRRTATARYRVSGPLEETVTENCTVIWRGEVFDVDGAPAHYQGTGDLDHTEFYLIKTRG